MRALKIAFSLLLCVTILSVGASVVCAVIAGNTAESFRDYRSSVITALSSLHAQLKGSQQAFADALTYLDGAQEADKSTEHATQTLPTPESDPETQPSTETTEQQSGTADAMQNEQTAPVAKPSAVMYTVREVNGCIGIYDADGTLLRTLQVPVSTLPRADREQLAVGIALTSKQELDALIEDYSG